MFQCGNNINNNKFERLAFTLLKEVDALNPPTPTQSILDLLDLKVEEFGNESPIFTIDKDDHRTITELQKDVEAQNKFNQNKNCFNQPNIKAILDVERQIIGINKSLHPAAKIFSTNHEVGHFYIPEHRKIALHECSYFDLSSKATKVMEKEANEFAAYLVFQCENFRIIAADYSLSLKSAIELATMFGASLESTFIRYITSNTNPCMLVVYDAFGKKKPYTIYPNGQYRRYGDWRCGSIDIASVNDFSINQVHSINSSLPYVTTNYLYPEEVFCNGYKIFVLCKPVKTRKTHIGIK